MSSDRIERFNVVIHGTILPGFEPDVVKEQLAPVLGDDIELARGTLDGDHSSTLRLGVDEEAAKRFAAGLRRIGVAASIQSQSQDFDTPSLAPKEPNQGPMSTVDLLIALGFEPDAKVISEGAGLSFNFGNLKLEASVLTNRWFQPIVLLSGVMTTPRTIGFLESEMPREVESWAQGVAWIAWCLEKERVGSFQPERYVPWLDAGRRNRHLLPWERQRAEYAEQAAAFAARPSCGVQREWARLALRDLADLIATDEDGRVVVFQFDGAILTMRCGAKTIAASATGNPWSSRYAIAAKSLCPLPRRLMSQVVDVSIWGDTLIVDTKRFSGVSDIGSDGPLP